MYLFLLITVALIPLQLALSMLSKFWLKITSKNAPRCGQTRLYFRNFISQLFRECLCDIETAFKSFLGDILKEGSAVKKWKFSIFHPQNKIFQVYIF